jgi:hypothetical protein
MEQNQRHTRRFRFRISTVLWIIAILALLLVIYDQSVELQRSRAMLEALHDRELIQRQAAEAARIRAHVAWEIIKRQGAGPSSDFVPESEEENSGANQR